VVEGAVAPLFCDTMAERTLFKSDRTVAPSALAML
jgi:hypothetical protein